MLSMHKTRPKSRILAYISTFAALNAVAGIIPFTPILGIPGASFRLDWVSSTLTGILLGPRIGGVSCLLGGLLGLLLGQVQFFGLFAPLRLAISAFIAGMLMSKNWRIPAITLLSLILLWVLMPTGRAAAEILVFHIVGLGLVLFLRKKIGELAEANSPRKNLYGLFIMSYCGNISRHLLGNVLLVTIHNLGFVYFVAAMPITLIEQLSFAIGTMVVGIALKHARVAYLPNS